jgi:Zn-dependent peptidase ImmA (M78 family)
MGDNPERAAQELLEAVWVDKRSGIDLPVDPIYIAQQLGIKVYTAYLDDGVSGTLIKRAGYADPEINLNAQDSRNRQRFTCAHELGHYVKRSAVRDDDEIWSYIDRRDSLAAKGTDPEEIYANQFAAALLMPADLVRELWKENHSSATLAYQFGVSVDAMNFRLENLGLR